MLRSGSADKLQYDFHFSQDFYEENQRLIETFSKRVLYQVHLIRSGFTNLQWRRVILGFKVVNKSDGMGGKQLQKVYCCNLNMA